MKNLLSPAVNRSDLRLNYNKNVFGRGSARGPRWESSSRRSPRPRESDGEGIPGYLLPIILPSRLGTKRSLIIQVVTVAQHRLLLIMCDVFFVVESGA